MVGRNLVGGEWLEGGGAPFVSTDPATGRAVWHGRASDLGDVGTAVAVARDALEAWEDRSFEDRARVTEAFAGQLRAKN
jgi:succinylglutamic semialdehyde dehydrogenase